MVEYDGVGESFLGGHKTLDHDLGPVDDLETCLASGESLVERLEDVGREWQETVVEVNHANKPLKRLDVEQLGVLGNGFDLEWKWLDTILVYFVAKEIDLRNAEMALFKFDDQSSKRRTRCSLCWAWFQFATRMSSR